MVTHYLSPVFPELIPGQDNSATSFDWLLFEINYSQNILTFTKSLGFRQIKRGTSHQIIFVINKIFFLWRHLHFEKDKKAGKKKS